MPRVCAVCASTSRKAIDEALIQGASYRGLAQRFVLPEDAVYRHKRAHVVNTLAQAQEAAALADAATLAAQVQALQGETRAILKEARDKAGPGYDSDRALRAIDRLARLVELLGKVSGALKDDKGVSINIAIGPLPAESEVRERLERLDTKEQALRRAWIEHGGDLPAELWPLPTLERPLPTLERLDVQASNAPVDGTAEK
jgi:hypothetical protein